MIVDLVQALSARWPRSGVSDGVRYFSELFANEFVLVLKLFHLLLASKKLVGNCVVLLCKSFRLVEIKV